MFCLNRVHYDYAPFDSTNRASSRVLCAFAFGSVLSETMQFCGRLHFLFADKEAEGKNCRIQSNF